MQQNLKRHETVNRLEQEKKQHIGQKMHNASRALDAAREALVQSYAFVGDEDKTLVIDLLDELHILDSKIVEHFKACIQVYSLHGSRDD